MSPQPSNLSSLARCKLNVTAESRCCVSLHRWVLLKNSVIRSLPLVASGNARCLDENSVDEERDSFVFPDAGSLLGGMATVEDTWECEAEWLDSLLGTLGEADDDIIPDPDIHVSVVPVEDDEDHTQLPPVSSSNDMNTQYPSSPHVDPLPYADPDDHDDFPPVPDAIEDTSDDESDALSTPGQSISSLTA
ncbi:hypothetical protein B0H15DRAFT_135957 [Mycena belliarum]|uniref:Uncharacterized protein n=1 Tax=Mycena belliarum TaxID=1033014 RepID=A0AAD6U896_9AGAR|nr:hypothetical protein B0H15DRAFT_135957 [Mycena belliae]